MKLLSYSIPKFIKVNRLDNGVLLCALLLSVVLVLQFLMHVAQAPSFVSSLISFVLPVTYCCYLKLVMTVKYLDFELESLKLDPCTYKHIKTTSHVYGDDIVFYASKMTSSSVGILSKERLSELAFLRRRLKDGSYFNGDVHFVTDCINEIDPHDPLDKDYILEFIDTLGVRLSLSQINDLKKAGIEF
ncbi:hypothetical protein VCHA53O466_40240 [Vibrio chagasii]|nr:hypothetical protein VCHA53O466_40240 [Vibrio chagasii]